jgi:peptidyl-Lys metalloendopeptidase
VLAALVLAVGLSAATAAPPQPAPLACSVEGPVRVRAGQAATFTLHLLNRGQRPVQLLTWATPFEPAWFAPWLSVQRGSKALRYSGAMIKRGDPQAGDYLSIAAGASASASFSLAPAFDISAPGRYTLRPQIVLHDLLVGTAEAVPRPRARHQAHSLRCNEFAFEVSQP